MLLAAILPAVRPALFATRVARAALLPSHSLAAIRLPLAFEPNRGQVAPRVRFVARAPGGSIFLTEGGITLATPAGRVSAMRPAGANPHPDLVPRGRLPGQVSYFIGNDPHRWHAGIPTFAEIEERGVYPGIDLRVHRPANAQAALEYDWVVHPGADPGRIRLDLGATGARVDSTGRLRTRGSTVFQTAPAAYQVAGGARRPVAARFAVIGGLAGLRLGPYDRHVALTVDPSIVYTTLLGGGGWDFASGVAADSGGDAYVAGTTGSLDLPVRHAVQTANHGGANGADVFVAKLDASGSRLLYSTYLGGKWDDSASAIAVDAAGRAYVTGFTTSVDFPTRHALRLAGHGQCDAGRNHPGDAFVAELGPAGSTLVYSTCLGGSRGDWGSAIAVLGGRAFVAGTTMSSDFPVRKASQSRLRGTSNAFVAEIAAGGRSLLVSTYLGGSGSDDAHAIALQPGTVWVAGSTTSADFPTLSPFQRTLAGGSDGFLTGLSVSNGSLIYSTYLGGSGDDSVQGLAVAGGTGYLAGVTSSVDFPTRNPLQGTLRGSSDAFVTALPLAGGAPAYSTYLGGAGTSRAMSVAVGPSGEAWVAGSSTADDFPMVLPVQPANAGGQAVNGDAVAACLSASGDRLLFSTFLGGAGEDAGEAVALDPAGDAFIAGATSSQDFPVSGGLNKRPPASGNAFVARIHAA